MNPNTVNTNAKPGNTASHGAVLMLFMLSERASPQSGEGGCAPSPRNESAVVEVIVAGIESEASTIMDGTIFGRI